MTRQEPIPYRGYTITLADYPQFGKYEYVSDDYDGPEDNRCGHENTIDDCKEAIDELIGERGDHPNNCYCKECRADDDRDAKIDRENDPDFH